MAPNSSNALVITGMHRSGTSLLASVLLRAGVHLGDRLLGPARGNPRGHFEDEEFVAFHHEALFTRDQHIVVSDDFTFEPTPQERERAQGLVAARSSSPLWGWKDPRTSLFLDFWSELIPDGAYLFLYRHPLEVLLSFVRRADVNYVGLAEAIHAWQAYNRAILSFRAREGKRTLLCEIHSLLSQPERFGHLVAERLNVDVALDYRVIESTYAPGELEHLSEHHPALAVFQQLYPSAGDMLRALDERADLPSSTAKSPGADSEFDPKAWTLPATTNEASRRAGLALLVANLDANAFERLFAEDRRHRTERERAVLWLQQQQRDAVAEVDRWKAQCDRLQNAVAQVDAGRQWLEQQRDAQQSEIQRWQVEYSRLQSAVADLERGRDWLLHQQRNAVTEVERWKTECGRLRDAVGQVDAGRQWLEEQREAQQSQIQCWQTEYSRLQGAVADLERGREWLLQQREAQREEIARWQTECEALRDAIAQLESGCKWLEDQRGAAQQEITRWSSEYETLKAWAIDREQCAIELARQVQTQETEMRILRERAELSGQSLTDAARVGGEESRDGAPRRERAVPKQQFAVPYLHSSRTQTDDDDD